MEAYKTHQPCKDCGSSDGLTINTDGSTKCYVCDKFTPSRNKQKMKGDNSVSGKEKKLYYNGEFRPLVKRAIPQETAKHFKVKVDDKGNIIYPFFNNEGDLVATKIRVAGDEKKFVWTGNQKEATLFGMNLFAPGSSKYLTVVEGQDDAMAAYKMLGSKYPVISVNSASTAARDVKNNIDYFEAFEYVVFILDNDEPGRKAAQSAAELLSPGKAKIVTLSRYKDANDYLKAKRAADFNSEFWNAKVFSAVGVVSFEDAWEAVVERKQTEILPLPTSMDMLSSMLGGGVAKGEITTVGALTSVGKTTFVNNMLYGFLDETEARVGYLGLETTVGELTSALIDLEAKKKLSENDSLAESKNVFDKIAWKDRLFIIDHQGSLELESMFRKIRNAIVAFDLDVFILDPLQQALPDLNNDTVKFAMDSLLKLAKQTNVAFVIVSHMKKPDTSNPHDVSEYDLLGSSAINQVSFNTILLSRDKMGESDVVKSSTKLRLVKSRRTGRTGEAGWLYYNSDTGVLEQGEDPYSFDEEMM